MLSFHHHKPKSHHHWDGTDSVSNDVRLEVEKKWLGGQKSLPTGESCDGLLVPQRGRMIASRGIRCACVYLRIRILPWGACRICSVFMCICIRVGACESCAAPRSQFSARCVRAVLLSNIAHNLTRSDSLAVNRGDFSRRPPQPPHRLDISAGIPRRHQATAAKSCCRGHLLFSIYAPLPPPPPPCWYQSTASPGVEEATWDSII